MKVRDWNDPRLRLIGKAFAAEAYDLASDLQNYGADASVLLLPQPEQIKLTATRREEVCIPTSFADALMALLLSLPRPAWASRGIREVDISDRDTMSPGRRRTWSPSAVEDLVNRGWSKRAAAKKEADRFGVPVKTVERGMQVWRAKKKPPPKRAPPKQ